MAKKDYYDILELSREAESGEIKKAYRRKAMEYHPDRNPDDTEAEERFKEAAEAYDVLSNPETKQLYDTYGHQGLDGAGVHSFTGFDDIFSSFSDIFGDLFGFGGGGGARTRTRARPGKDLRYDLTITLEEVARGVAREIEIERYEGCLFCKSTGIEPGTEPETCAACNGLGQITNRQGFFTISTTCPRCRGQGRFIKHPCSECRGTGQTKVRKKVNIKIPPGVEEGMKLRVSDEGEEGERGAPSGDLYIFLYVEPHSLFRREGDDIVCQIPISFPQAGLGAEMEVPSLNSTKTITVPRGTQTGDLVRIKGEGLPHLRGRGKGDQIVQFIVRTPVNLTSRQEELLREFAGENDEPHKPKKQKRRKKK